MLCRELSAGELAGPGPPSYAGGEGAVPASYKIREEEKIFNLAPKKTGRGFVSHARLSNYSNSRPVFRDGSSRRAR